MRKMLHGIDNVSSSFSRGGRVGVATLMANQRRRLVDLFELSQSFSLNHGVVHLQGQNQLLFVLSKKLRKQKTAHF